MQTRTPDVVEHAGQDPAGADPPLLHIEGLNVLYRKGTRVHQALRQIDLTLYPGQRVALVGESGSGKTTLGTAVAGFLGQDPDVEMSSSRFDFAGRPLNRRHRSRIPERTAGIAMIFQDAMTSLDPVWTIGSQFRHVLTASGDVPRSQVRRRAVEWLARVGLPDADRILRARPYELSGGMRQRVMIAIALCGAPRLLIADEPTSALDASLARGVMDLLTELATDLGTALLMISHDIHLCQEYADTILVMYQGELVERGAGADLERTATHPYTVGLLRCAPTLEHRRARRLPTLSDFLPDGPTGPAEVGAGDRSGVSDRKGGPA